MRAVVFVVVAALLGLPGSAATSQTVELFTTDTEPGTYTVSWSTRGGCDPNAPNSESTIVTDGATGTVVRTVAVPAGTERDAVLGDEDAQGEAIQFTVVTASHCNYDFVASFTSNLDASAGIRCLVGPGPDSTNPTALSRSGVIGVDLADDADTSLMVTANFVTECNTIATINVLVSRPTVVNDDAESVPSQPHSGAILSAVFTVTATPDDDSHADCGIVTESTEVDDKETATTDDDTVTAALSVLRTPLTTAGVTCQYDVSVVAPHGFAAVARNSDTARVDSFADISPSSAATSRGAAATALNNPDHCDTEVFVSSTGAPSTVAAENTVPLMARCDHRDVEVRLQVAVRRVYLLQNVVGDSGGASSKYSLSEDADCISRSDLPENLLGIEVGGIQTAPEVTTVELREGFFNISAAVMGPETVTTDDSDRTYAPRFARNEDGEPCRLIASVTELPSSCGAEQETIVINAARGADSDGRLVATFSIRCDNLAVSDAAPGEGDNGDDGPAATNAEERSRPESAAALPAAAEPPPGPTGAQDSGPLMDAPTG